MRSGNTRGNQQHHYGSEFLIYSNYVMINHEKGVYALCQGQETSAITVSTVLLMLAMHKNIQEKVVDELKTSINDSIDFDTLNQLPYLEMVIKETMRLFPVAAFTLRTTSEDFEVSKYLIPAGANLFLSIYTLHRDKTHWGDDADSFIPERFEAEKFKKIHPYAYVPFTGERIKLIIIAI